ncbi:carbohydrate porin [Lichenihabitans psoromatis]|uniref:carbohydrate porin n=1 Tax=Lichenihabitans psoromatis TaxID=2528642 RepID=UPI00103847A5|nr:carbohydrate porin [Lichenihabitans psoromatis]
MTLDTCRSVRLAALASAVALIFAAPAPGIAQTAPAATTSPQSVVPPPAALKPADKTAVRRSAARDAALPKPEGARKPAAPVTPSNPTKRAKISHAAVEPEHAFGDWDGFRTRLAKYGVNYSLNYTTESVANVSGGVKAGAAYAHQIALAVDVNWQTLAGLDEFSTHTIFINRAGNNASARFIGDNVLQAQEIYGAGFGQIVKLVWFYGEQKLADDKIDIAFGRLAPGSDFGASPLNCNFMTLTICGHNRALTSLQGFEDWPTSVWGARIKGQTTDTTYIMTGLFQSQPFPVPGESYTQGGYSGFDWTLKGTTGVSIPLELGFEPRLGPDEMPGHYKLGFNYDTSDYPDTFFDRQNLPLALTGLTGRPHHGRAQFWVEGDQMIARNGPNDNDGIILLASYAHDDSNTSLIRNFLWAGVLDRGFWDARPQDQIGFAATYYDVSNKITRTEQLEQSLDLPLYGNARGVQRNGAVFEANYGIHVAPGVLIQPELEYFLKPGATAAVSNSFLIGAKTNIDF